MLMLSKTSVSKIFLSTLLLCSGLIVYTLDASPEVDCGIA